MTTRIKICGITNLDDALAACDAGADALGFVFAPEARRRNRYIAPADTADIIARLPVFVTTVAVVVNEPPEALRGYLDVVDLLQLHGEESPELCRALGRRAFKAVRAASEADLPALADWPCGTILLDAMVPGDRGGTGTVCDWNLAAKAVAECGRRIVLAGGLDPENVGEAVRLVRPWAVDVSSGVECAPGKKSHERIRRFIGAVREASLA